MGAARVEIYSKTKRLSAAGEGQLGPLAQVATETTSTTATTAGSRITATGIPAGSNGYASIVVDEDCLVAIGTNPTAAVAPAASWLVKANVARELPIRGGEKISFKDVA